MRFVIEANADEVHRMLNSVHSAVDTEAMTDFLTQDVNEHLVDRILARFQYEGDVASGDWKPLAESTQQIRRELGYPASGPVNERTTDMETFLLSGTFDMLLDGVGATLIVPGPINDPVLEKKIRTAQEGSNDNPLPGTGPTPPRPVLALDDQDVVEIMSLLQVFIVGRITGGGALA